MSGIARAGAQTRTGRIALWLRSVPPDSVSTLVLRVGQGQERFGLWQRERDPERPYDADVWAGEINACLLGAAEEADAKIEAMLVWHFATTGEVWTSLPLRVAPEDGGARNTNTLELALAGLKQEQDHKQGFAKLQYEAISTTLGVLKDTCEGLREVLSQRDQRLAQSEAENARLYQRQRELEQRNLDLELEVARLSRLAEEGAETCERLTEEIERTSSVQNKDGQVIDLVKTIAKNVGSTKE